MCGIVGAVCAKDKTLALESVLEGLSRLEYRGYDSAGVAQLRTEAPPEQRLKYAKEVGKLSNLRTHLAFDPLPEAAVAIGHTRWATHGGVTRENAHPHLSWDGQLALIHNGIVENAPAYRQFLLANGVQPVSETDTEVVAHLLQRSYLALREQGVSSLPAGTCPLGELDSSLTAEAALAATRLALAMSQVMRDLEGSFTLLAIHQDAPGVVVAARRSSPLVIGLSEGGNYLGSDVLAFVKETKTALEIGQDELVVVSAAGVLVCDDHARQLLRTAGETIVTAGAEAPAGGGGLSGAGSGTETPAGVGSGTGTLSGAQASEIEKRLYQVDFAAQRVTKEGFPTFMEKEIHEQPRAVGATLRDRLDADGHLTLDELRISADQMRSIESIIIVACGTAAYAGQVARYAIEHWCRIPCEVELAHEFRYRDPIVSPRTLVVAISQSGETMDTIMAIRHAREQGAKVLAIVNTAGSTISRESDAVLLTHAGPEIAVASTKAFTAQVAACYLLGLYLAQVRGNKYADEIADYLEKLGQMPARIQTVLDGFALPGAGRGSGDGAGSGAAGGGAGAGTGAGASAKENTKAALDLQSIASVIFLGRHVGFPVALEGALKLKEIAYVHAEGFAAGELKHGPIALVETGQPVVVIVPTPRRPELHRKVVSNIQEVRARGAFTIVIAEDGDTAVDEFADVVWRVPPTPTLFRPLVDVVPLQLFAAQVATARGLDVDQPRNLAKSVTVE